MPRLSPLIYVVLAVINAACIDSTQRDSEARGFAINRELSQTLPPFGGTVDPTLNLTTIGNIGPERSCENHSYVLPSCDANSVTAGSYAHKRPPMTIITIDGNGDEWPSESIVAFDIAGDGVTTETAFAHAEELFFDLVEYAVLQDEDFVYFRIRTALPAQADAAGRFYLNFGLFTPGQIDSTEFFSQIQTTHDRTGSAELYIYDFGNPHEHMATPIPNEDAQIVFGDVLEIRLNKSFLFAHGLKETDFLKDNAFVSLFTTLDDNEFAIFDEISTFLIQPTKLYHRCDIQTSEQNYTRVTTSYDANDANHVLWAHFVDQQSPGIIQTLHAIMGTANPSGYSISQQFSPIGYAAGVNNGSFGITYDPNAFLRNFADNNQEITKLVAHELGHYYNTHLPFKWLIEGHSVLLAHEILRRHFGEGAAKAYHAEILKRIANQGDRDAPLENWTNETDPDDELYFYDKAYLLLSLINSQYGIENLVHKIVASTPRSLTDESLSAFFTRIETTFNIDLSTLSPGWISAGAYGQQWPITMSYDVDRDGFSNYDEILLGLDAQNPDSDQDGVNDWGEWQLCRDPRVADNETEIRIDGLGDDWTKNIGQAQFAKPLSSFSASQNCPSASAIKKFYAFIKDDQFCGYIETMESFRKDQDSLQISMGIFPITAQDDSTDIFTAAVLLPANVFALFNSLDEKDLYSQTLTFAKENISEFCFDLHHVVHPQGDIQQASDIRYTVEIVIKADGQEWETCHQTRDYRPHILD